MVDILKLKNLDTIPSGSKRYRRRIPKDVQEILGEDWFQRGLKAIEGDGLLLEHAACVEEFKDMVSQARSVVSKMPGYLLQQPLGRSGRPPY